MHVSHFDTAGVQEAFEKAKGAFRSEVAKLSLELDGLKWEKEEHQGQLQRYQTSLLDAQAGAAQAEVDKMHTAEELARAQEKLK
eukprot:scaffold671517_cov51-Prasinocladus_malaysianus.AAC.1